MSMPEKISESEGETGVQENQSQIENQDLVPSTDPDLHNIPEGTPAQTNIEGMEDGLRRSSREKKLTHKAQQNQEEEKISQVKRVNSSYEQWRKHASRIRKDLKVFQGLNQLQEFQLTIEKHREAVVGAYDKLKKTNQPDSEVVSKLDNCCSISEALLDILMQKRLESPEEFDVSQTKDLRCRHPSVFSESVSDRMSIPSCHSTKSSVSSLRARAELEKAEKLAAAKALQEEQLQRSKILKMQVQIEEEKMKLEAIQAGTAVKVAEAKCDALSEVEEENEEPNMPTKLNSEATTFKPRSQPNNDHVQMPCGNQFKGGDNPGLKADTARSAALHTHDPVGESSLAQALASAMDRNRLPVPTPKVFSGNPMDFVSFKRSFATLIENKGISAEEKIYYLQQYVSGEAKESIAGCFYGRSESDYQRAWEILDRRYGHPFKIGEAFRDKLDKWPRVGQRDSAALQKYSDFLRSCLDAMPHIESLTVLNDCKENQKMVAKLPDWGINRWSRIVTDTLDNTHQYPNFAKFVAFVEKEARIARHPVASLSAVRGTESFHDIKPQREERKKPVRSLSTGTGPASDQHSSGTDVAQKSVTQGQSSSSEAKPERKKSCPFCKGEHYLSSCLVFVSKPIDERNLYIREQKRCFGCLRTGHYSKHCKSRHICQKCKGRHPTVLHDNDKAKATPQNSNQQPSTENAAVSLKTNAGHSCTTNVLPVWVSSVGRPEREKLVYALLDTQSDSTFIDEKICEELCVPTNPIKLKLTTILGKDATVMCQRVKGLRVRGYSSSQFVELPVTYTRDLIPLDRSHIPTCETASSWDHLSDIASEIPPLLDCGVGLLIGFDCSTALTPRQVIPGEGDQPYAIRTDLGWSVVGKLGSADSADVTGFCHRISVKEAPPAIPRDVLKILERDFADSKHGDIGVSQEDIQFLNFMESGVTVNSRGHLEMPLPFKSRPNLANNRKLAVVRLSHLKKRLDQDPVYKGNYCQFMDEMLQDGDAELATEKPGPGEVWYIPHHGVFHPKKPDKLRVVFDCSAKYKGSALNDYLLSGPDLTNSLFGVLCRFRRENVAVMCDVQKMFHRFHVHPEDRDYLRFLWYPEGDTSTDPLEYRMNVHLFGARSSPGCANFGLKYLSRMYEKDYPQAAPFLRQDFYVDDGVTSVDGVEKAKELIREARELCSQGNLRLHKFISNNRSVLESVPISERVTDVQEVDLSKEMLPIERTLGVYWNIEVDAFTFQINVQERPNTRRGILSLVASMYDPLGFISPFVLRGKAVLQEMCRRGTDWDEVICEDLRPGWEQWKEDIPNLRDIHLPRCYKPRDFGPLTRVELHHFSDASTVGYGVCSYLRFVAGSRVHCTLIVGKSRVSPTRVVTVPRLELTAAVVAVKLSTKLKQELQMHIDGEHFWCDSQVVLAYINNDAKKFHVFVSNRVQLIREHTDVKQWHYVSTKENPADHASRGLCAGELLSTNWYTGPEFLWKCDPIESHYVEQELMVGDPEVRATAFSMQTESARDLLERLCKFSSWAKLTKIVARIQCLARGQTGNKVMTVEEINQAGLSVIKLVQKETFKEEIQVLNKQGDVPSTSKLFNLNPFIQDGVVRVGGRLRKSSMSLNEKHPVVLPKSGHMTQLIIAHCHGQIKHQGRGQTLNEIRSQGYWILGGSKLVAEFIRRCVICRRLRRPVEEQKMADLPEDRVEPSPPFTFCGMDCFGPFVTKHGRKEYKRYGLLFTCLCSRAVHIEVVEDMTTDAFIIALRCFIAIRGTVRQIRSDQGSNFIGADNELKAAMKELDVERVTAYLTEKQCTFIFNAPHSSHAGGVWERQIRSVRNILEATMALCPGRLDDGSLRCFMYEAMSIVNSRPLSPVNMLDPAAEAPLTPNHLVTMKSSSPLPPPGNFVKEDLYARKRWRRVQFLSEQFWSRWKREYLQNLQQRGKWNVPRRNLRVGDIVLVKDHETPRMEWPLAVVKTAEADDDGLVRRVWVRMGSRALGSRLKKLELERPIQKLVLLVENVESPPSASQGQVRSLGC